MALVQIEDMIVTVMQSEVAEECRAIHSKDTFNKCEIEDLLSTERITTKTITNIRKLAKSKNDQPIQLFINLHHKELHSTLRSNNYLIMNNALPFNNKYSNRKGKCSLCKEKTEDDVDHVFIYCRKTMEYLKYIKEKTNNIKIAFNLKTVIFGDEISYEEYYNLSV